MQAASGKYRKCHESAGSVREVQAESGKCRKYQGNADSVREMQAVSWKCEGSVASVREGAGSSMREQLHVPHLNLSYFLWCSSQDEISGHRLPAGTL